MAGPDNSSVIVSDYQSDKWTFSTIFDPKYGQHPVSGHRDFGPLQISMVLILFIQGALTG